MRTILIIAVTVTLFSAENSVAQDAEKGKMVFNMCLPCHSIGPGAQNKIAPELNGLDGRHSGSAPDFDYSDANPRGCRRAGVLDQDLTVAAGKLFAITSLLG